MHEEQRIIILKALADSVRLAIVRDIACDRAQCADLRAKRPLSQPAMSHHLIKLVEAGVLIEHKTGVRKCYEVNEALLCELGIDIGKLTARPDRA